MEDQSAAIMLTEVEARVLGSLMEKEVTTPEYYPLTLNSLVQACNQKSNRDPVTTYDEQTVMSALRSLMEKKLVFESIAGGRVPKYMQNLTGTLNLLPKEIAVLCVLMLRGPQTLGEIRSRSERMYNFPNLEEVQETLRTMMDGGYVARLARQPGHKEPRYVHLLCEQPAAVQEEDRQKSSTAGTDELIGLLEEELKKLRQEFEALREEFAAFRKQFE